jgi:hypothetical protein
MTENSDRIDRTLEVLLYAPIGVGLFLKDTAPQFVDMFVARGRAEIDRRHDDVQQRVTTARSLGQVAMAFGPPIVRQRVERTVADARRTVEGLIGSAAPSGAAARPTAPTPPATRTEPAPFTSSHTVPLESAPAASVSPQPAPAASDLGNGSGNGSSPTNGDASASAALPIPGYDALSASQVVERLIGLAPDELDAVQSYEAAHRQRRTILGKIEQLAAG